MHALCLQVLWSGCATVADPRIDDFFARWDMRRPLRSCMQAFREPLYLQDRPVQLPDTRSEEEVKYPELFRHRSRAAEGAVRAPRRLTAA